MHPFDLHTLLQRTHITIATVASKHFEKQSDMKLLFTIHIKPSCHTGLTRSARLVYPCPFLCRPLSLAYTGQISIVTLWRSSSPI